MLFISIAENQGINQENVMYDPMSDVTVEKSVYMEINHCDECQWTAPSYLNGGIGAEGLHRSGQGTRCCPTCGNDRLERRIGRYHYHVPNRPWWKRIFSNVKPIKGYPIWKDCEEPSP